MEKNKPNIFLFIISAILIIWGVFTVGTASFPLSLERYGTPWHFLYHQLAALGIGLVLGFVAFKFPLKKIRKWAPYLFLASLCLLLLVFVPKIGIEGGGAHRWISLGVSSFQPSELLKITFIIYLAAWLCAKKKHKIVPFLVILGFLAFILIAQPDMTTLCIIALAGFAMYVFSSVPWWHIAVFMGAGSAAVTAFILLAPYRLSRFLTFLNPELDPLGSGYQLQQASIAIGSGGLLGIGNGLSFGLSRQKFGFLPESITDSIFAIISEELGFAGSLALIILFLLFVWQGLKVVKKKGESFEGFLALGVVVWIGIQALLNIGGITGIIPMGGIPLPFFSYGGSHLMVEMIGIGLLLNISKNT